MATTIYFRSAAASTHRGDNTLRLDGVNGLWQCQALSTARGASTISNGAETVTGPTAGQEIRSSAGTIDSQEWISEPLDQGVTISGTITLNLWGHESAMTANVAINAIMERLDSQGGIVSTIAQTARTTELGTTNPPTSAQNFTVTPTSTAMLKGDRLRIRVYGDDAGTMASGANFSFWFDGPTGGSNGDSFVTFTETFGFETTTPAGTQLFLTDVAGPAVGANIEKEMWTSRGDGVNSIIRNTAVGWTAPLQWTDSGGGTAVEWYSKQLQAFTLADLVRCNLRARQSGATANASPRAELAVCNDDGSGVSIWGATNFNDVNEGELTTSETALTIDISGDDTSVGDGQRLRLRVYIDDTSDAPMASGFSATLFYDGTSGGASGDSWIQLTQSVLEFVPALAVAAGQPMLMLLALHPHGPPILQPYVLPGLAPSNIFDQALTATVTITASIVKSVGKLLSATATSTASIVKSVGKGLSATITTTASITNSVGKVLSATVTTTASIVKSVGLTLSATVISTAEILAPAFNAPQILQPLLMKLGLRPHGPPLLQPLAPPQAAAGALFQQALTATVTAVATIVNQVGKVLSATATSSALIVKSVGKSVSATVTSAASIVKSIGKILSATVTSTATIVAQTIKALAMTATVTTTASIVKSVGKILSATATTTATIVKSVGKILSATATATASIIKSVSTTLSATATATADLLAVFQEAAIAALSQLRPLLMTLRIRPQGPPLLKPYATPLPTFFQQILTATVTTLATIQNQVGKILSATATTTATIVRTVGKNLSATATSAATIALQKTILRAMTATVTTTASIARGISKGISATVSVSASIVKSVGKTLVTTVTSTASMVATAIFAGAVIVLGRFSSNPRGVMSSSPEEGNFDDSEPNGEVD